ncbi:MAG: acyl-coenzyme A thioesterase PaaI-like protein, partial [Ilumatobacter sp.]
FIFGSRPAEELDAVGELVAPEEGNRLVGLGIGTCSGGEQILGGERTLFGGVGPVFDPHLLAEKAIGPAQHVTGCVHTGHRGSIGVDRIQGGIADHAIANGEAAIAKPGGGGHDANSNEHHVGFNQFANTVVAGQHHAIVVQPINTDVASHGHPFGFVERSNHCAHLGTEAADQRSRATFEHGDVIAELAGGSGDFETDKPGPDYHDTPSTIGNLGAQAHCIIERSKLMGMGIPALLGEAPARGPGGNHAAIELEVGAVGEVQDARCGIEASRRHAEAPLDVEFVERVWLTQLDPVRLPLPCEQLLRKRWTVVRPMRLGTDDDDLTLKPFVAQRLSCTQPSERCTDNNDPIQLHAAKMAHSLVNASSVRTRFDEPTLTTTVPPMSEDASTIQLELPSAEQVNAMIEELFPGTGNACAKLGDGFALASRSIDETMLRPGGFVSGPTQFGLADAALWYMVFAATGRIEPMAMTSELSIRYLRPAQGSMLWARATLESAGRRNVVGTVHVWCDDREHKPSSIAQGTYALPA